MRRRRGFTLVELMAVVAIMAVAISVVVVNLDYLTPKYALRAEARSICANFQFARSTAIAQGETFSVGYDFDQNSFFALMPPETDEDGHIVDDERVIAGGAETVLHRFVKLVSVLLPDDTEHDSGRVVVDVSPQCDVGSHIVVLGNDRDERLTIRMDSYTGSVIITDRELSFWPEQEEEDEQQQAEEEEE